MGCTHLGNKTSIGDHGIKNVVNEDRQYLKETLFSSGGDGVGGMIRIGPSVRTIREASICEVIDDAFVRVLFRAQENQTTLTVSSESAGGAEVLLFECMRTPTIVED